MEREQNEKGGVQNAEGLGVKSGGPAAAGGLWPEVGEANGEWGMSGRRRGWKPRVLWGLVSIVTVFWGPTWRGEIGEFCLGDLQAVREKTWGFWLMRVTE